MDKYKRQMSINSALVNILKLLAEEITEEISETKRLWVKKWIGRRDSLGASNLLFKELELEDPSEYFNAFRMSENSFNLLLNEIRDQIQRRDTHMRCAVTAKTKLQAVLYFLATGCSLKTLQYIFRLGKSTLSKFIPEVCKVIYESLEDFIKVPNENEWKIIENGFREKWNFPGCCGAVDGKHVVIKAPDNCGSLYYNYKQTNSIVLMAVVDHDYCFRYIDVGCNGRISDGGVFRQCSLYRELENGMLPEGNFLVGDNAFPLKDYLLKPFPQHRLTLKEKVFNYRLSRARRIVENAFGLLVSRFRIFEKPIPFCPDKVDLIIKACCALHNWLRISNTQHDQQNDYSVDIENHDTGEIIEGNWRNSREPVGLFHLSRNSINRSTRQSQDLRERLSDYFMEEGSVPWQMRMIH